MSYERCSRVLAVMSCLFTASLFATSMAIAAINVGDHVVTSASAHAAVVAMSCPQS